LRAILAKDSNMLLSRDVLAPARIWRHSRARTDELRAYQEHQLRRIVAYAQARVPYYRRLHREAGVSPGDIWTLDDLRALPTTSKADLRSVPVEERLAGGARPDRLLTSRTTGSTGIPFTTLTSRYEDLLQHLFRLRALQSYGLGLRDKMVKIFNRPRMPGPWLGLQALGLYRQVQLDLTDPIEDLAQTLDRERPDVLIGNAGVVTRVAQHLLEDGISGVRPRYIVVSAELLTPQMRRQIEHAFDAPVHDQYATMELGLLAWQCRQTRRYHVCSDSVVLEVLRNGSPVGPGEQGEVVVTNLHALHMPFVRYRLEDVVAVGEDSCPCGQPFPTIQMVQGRMTDYLELPGGRSLFAAAVAYVLHADAPWIQQYELVQERVDRVRLRAVARPLPAVADLAALRARVERVLGPGVAFDTELVRAIEPGPGGKFRVLRSHVRSPYQ
jgi:phenylacetate-CoA ligase